MRCGLLGFLIFFAPFMASGQNKSKDLTVHLLNRLTFGPRPSEPLALDFSKPVRFRGWLNEQLHPDKIDDSALEAKLRKIPSLDIEPKERLQKYVPGNEEGLRPPQLDADMQGQKLIRAVESRRQLQEVLVDFWFNHFNIDMTKGKIRFSAAEYENEIRHHLFDHFEDLLLATARHPVMLVYLDNRQSKKGGLNENYAREVMELHTMGVESGYTQNDIIELARILTGWSVKDGDEEPAFVFRKNVHDDGEKNFLKMNFPAGRGEDEGYRALQALAHHPKTADFIAGQLVRFFVSDNPPPLLVKKVATTFRQTQGDLRAVYLTLFTDPEFYSLKHQGEKIKRPFFFVTSSLRAMGAEVLDGKDLSHRLKSMGEDLYHCPPPTGYRDVAQAWVNSGSMIERLQFSLDLSSQKIKGILTDVPPVIEKKSVQALILETSQKWIHRRPQDSTLKVMLAQMQTENPFYADDEVRPLVKAKIAGLLLGSPEFQRR